ncbi:zf-HC2 domain-containing protein [bacterium]|nr:zf-HC2 domain-containing protein [bacterium]
MNWHGPEDVTVLLYLEEAMSASDRRLFEAHLEECQECRLELDATRRLQGLTKTWAEVEPPAHLAEGIRSSLRPASPSRRWMLAAAALLMLLLGLQALKPVQGPQTASTEAPSTRLVQASPAAGEKPTAMALATQQQVWITGKESSVVAFAGQVLTLGPHTKLQVMSRSGNHYVLRLRSGDVRVQEHGEAIAVVTQHLRVDPLGTDYQVFVGSQRSKVQLYTGKVRVTSQPSGEVVDLVPGRHVEFPAPPALARKPQSPKTTASPGPKLPGTDYPVRIPTASPSPLVEPPLDPWAGNSSVWEPESNVERPGIHEPQPGMELPQGRPGMGDQTNPNWRRQGLPPWSRRPVNGGHTWPAQRRPMKGQRR